MLMQIFIADRSLIAYRWYRNHHSVTTMSEPHGHVGGFTAMCREHRPISFSGRRAILLNWAAVSVNEADVGHFYGMTLTLMLAGKVYYSDHFVMPARQCKVNRTRKTE